MQSIEQTLAATRMFRNLTREQLAALARLGEEVEYADGSRLMIEGEPADWFFVIREGFVALQTDAPSGAITIETLHNGDSVGWSWLFEPYLAHFDARSRGVTRVIRFDGAALRERCAEEPALGYELMRGFASVIVQRLQATRLQLLDVYGGATQAIRFDAATLRVRCAEDRELGYELMRSFASVIVERLQATRLQLLDVYGRATVS